MSWWQQLDHKRGSQPRCVSFMHGDRREVAQRLTELVNCPEVSVERDAVWMPLGLPRERGNRSWDVTFTKEAILDKCNPFLSTGESQALRKWWLKHPHPQANTPNWDIASQCRVNGHKGLLLIEAKAHANELEAVGKKLREDASVDSYENHVQIGRVIADASATLQRATKLPCAISRDHRYQMSNRFAMACKLTEMGYAVVLVYLGFLNADEMSDRGEPFGTTADWQSCVERHSSILFPSKMWEQHWNLNGRLFFPLIRAQGWDYQMVQPMDVVKGKLEVCAVAAKLTALPANAAAKYASNEPLEEIETEETEL